MPDDEKNVPNENGAPEENQTTPEVEPVRETADGEAQTGDEPTPAQWREALEQCVKQRDEYLLLAQRTQAEFSNFRRRNAQVRADAYDDGVRETLSALLPSLDNLDRATEAADKTKDYAALAAGVQMTRNGLIEAMRKMGLEEVPALGEAFDPELHNAVLRGEDGEPGTVTEVFQKGYRVKGRMIRYAMVKVAAE